jgi:hypothetical protein
MAATQSQSEVLVKPRHTYSAVAALCVVFFALAPILNAQEAAATRPLGIPQDWTQRHIVFSRDALAQHPELVDREPRVRQQMMQRWQPPTWGSFQGIEPRVEPIAIGAKRSGPQRDWNMSLGAARPSPHAFPVKYTFDPAATPSCTNDFVAFGMAIPGTTGGQANLVAFNNLYVNPAGTGFCTGTAPTVMFAYNVTPALLGKIVTSLILSEDGTKIGFVESGTGTSPISTFNVVTWAAGDGTSVITSVAPGVSPAVGTMQSVTFSSTSNSTTSSPWVDYDSDTAYVGTDDGHVYQITGVFHGTPAVSGSPWPISLAANNHLSPPVLDGNLGLLMVGAQNGNLYQINVATGTIVGSLAIGSGATTSGIIAPPVVDITNGTTFVVSANGNGGGGAVLAEIDTASFTSITSANIGEGSSGGTALHLYEPAFSNDYYNSPAAGKIRLCGTGALDTSPWQYAFGFIGRTLNPGSSFSQQLLTSTAARCTGWTEFFNPNIGSFIGTDFFFFGLTQDCTGTGTANGCVAEITNAATTPVTATVPGGPSGIVVDNFAKPSGISSFPEASSIYFSAVGVSTAYKFTQNGLQ